MHQPNAGYGGLVKDEAGDTLLLYYVRSLFLLCCCTMVGLCSIHMYHMMNTWVLVKDWDIQYRWKKTI